MDRESSGWAERVQSRIDELFRHYGPRVIGKRRCSVQYTHYVANLTLLPVYGTLYSTCHINCTRYTHGSRSYNGKLLSCCCLDYIVAVAYGILKTSFSTRFFSYLTNLSSDCQANRMSKLQTTVPASFADHSSPCTVSHFYKQNSMPNAHRQRHSTSTVESHRRCVVYWGIKLHPLLRQRARRYATSCHATATILFVAIFSSK